MDRLALVGDRSIAFRVASDRLLLIARSALLEIFLIVSMIFINYIVNHFSCGVQSNSSLSDVFMSSFLIFVLKQDE